MTPLDTQLRALNAMLSARDTHRAARADFLDAFKAARDAGVTEETLAEELLRDSYRHGDLDGLAALARELSDTPWDDERAPAGPRGGYCTRSAT